MKRHQVALLLQPYKNALMDPGELRESAGRFAEQLLELGSGYPNFHFNVVMPAYVLESINPLLLSKLRDMHKRGTLEWIPTGYTEPFFSFSPRALTEENIRHGLAMFVELTGTSPAGLAPSFSNWEPSYIPLLRNLGLTYSVLSHIALPQKAQQTCGYWFTEQAGDAIALVPTHILHHYSAPADIIDWLEKLVSRDEKDPLPDRFVSVQYQLPLHFTGGIDPYRWLKYAIAEIDKRILMYEPLLVREALSQQPPRGLLQLPPCLPQHEFSDGQEPHYFLNRLHSYDQIGIMQRKLFDIHDRLAALKDNRLAGRLRKSLFFLQDINRFLPAKDSGFTVLADRLWSYSRLIEIERELAETEHARGGRMHITDFLRNGNKSIIMSNGGLKVYCDYKNGGHLYELDYIERSVNLFAAFNPLPHDPPDIVSPGTTYSSFIDRIYPEATGRADILSGSARDAGTFAEGEFDYKVKKTAHGVKMALSRLGAVLQGEKSIPLFLEKVFGLEKDDATLSFVYQIANHSLAGFGVVFATELHLSLPGTIGHQVRLINGKNVHTKIGWEPIILEKTTRWSVSDLAAGVRIQFITQKPLDVFCLPLPGREAGADPSCGIRIVLASPLALEPSSSWTLIGNLICKKLREKRKDFDAI